MSLNQLIGFIGDFWNFFFGTAIALGAWFAKTTWKRIEDTQRLYAELRDDLHTVEKTLPAVYVMKADFDRRMDQVDTKLDRILDKMDAKADKL